ncbi:MAG: o-succinylbenzoate--CoA ligase [Candidatus Binatia bacterium]
MSVASPWLAQCARRHGAKTAMHFAGEGVTWAALAALSENLAAGFSRLGVARGDVVAVRMAPHPRMAAILHALQMLGAAMLPLNLRLAEPEARRILSHAAPRLFVDGIGTCGASVVHPFDDLDGGLASKSFAAPARLDPAAALTIVYTSGTTSAPKGVVLTNANHAAAAAASRQRLGHGEADTWLGTLPLFHVGGLAILVRSALEGSTVLLESGFDDARAAQALERGDATIVSMVPTMLARVLDRLDGAVSPRVRCVLVGGAALSPSLGRRALEAGLPIAATYGMTEACSQICTTEPASSDAAGGRVGRPLQGVEVRIDKADDDGNGEGIGEILVRGPTVMRGYLDNAEADRASLRGGWLRTGDLGRLGDNGSLAVSGRVDDLVVTGGENVAPLEVEQVLDQHPHVAESMVMGVDDEKWGQRVVALVVAREGCEPGADALREWCRVRMASYKTPREFRFTAELPRGATGKLLRRSLR